MNQTIEANDASIVFANGVGGLRRACAPTPSLYKPCKHSKHMRLFETYHTSTANGGGCDPPPPPPTPRFKKPCKLANKIYKNSYEKQYASHMMIWREGRLS